MYSNGLSGPLASIFEDFRGHSPLSATTCHAQSFRKLKAHEEMFEMSLFQSPGLRKLRFIALPIGEQH